MKLFLDDLRDPPDSSWRVVRTAEEAIKLLQEERITVISLDHDLGTDLTGHDVILWLEEQVYLNNFVPPRIKIHSANPVGREKMLRGIASIERKQHSSKR